MATRHDVVRSAMRSAATTGNVRVEMTNDPNGLNPGALDAMSVLVRLATTADGRARTTDVRRAVTIVPAAEDLIVVVRGVTIAAGA